MSVATALPHERPITWEEYAALAEHADTAFDGSRYEYIDGRLVVTPGGDRFHQQRMRSLANALDAVIPPTHEVNTDWAWKPANDEFRPDVFVYSTADADAGSPVRFTGVPALAVEIVSSNRRAGLVRKATKYASLGLPHYWIIDSREQTISAYALDDGVYRLTAQIGLAPGLTAEAELDFGLAALQVCVHDVFGA